MRGNIKIDFKQVSMADNFLSAILFASLPDVQCGSTDVICEVRKIKSSKFRVIPFTCRFYILHFNGRLRRADHVARMEEGRSAFKMLTGKPIGKRPLGKPRRRWETILEWTLKR